MHTFKEWLEESVDNAGKRDSRPNVYVLATKKLAQMDKTGRQYHSRRAKAAASVRRADKDIISKSRPSK